MQNYIIRGIILGGSVGIIAALMGFSDSVPRAFGVGMVAGFLAGITLQWRNKKR